MMSRRGDPSRTASIYNNPFEVEKHQLIRQLFEFPARIAAFVQSQKSDGNSGVIESPFIVLASKWKASDEMEARQSGSGDVGVQIVDSSEMFFAQPLLTKPLGTSDECALETSLVATSDQITYSRRKRKFVNQSEASGDGLMEAEVMASSLPALTNNSKQHDVAEFIVEVIRALRHTRNDDTEKLFKLLSVPDFPIDKCSFLEELIRQAYCYNKDVVAKQLMKYRSEIRQPDHTVNLEMEDSA